MALILAIESSCDETSVAITRDGKLLSNVINTQIEVHQKYGGVMPEIASRLHCENISLVLKEALEKADVKLEDIDAFAVTRGPGLIGALHVGMQCAKTLAMLYKKPLIPVHHLAGHIYANEYNEELKFPLLAVVVSGGNSELVIMKEKFFAGGKKNGYKKTVLKEIWEDWTARPIRMPLPRITRSRKTMPCVLRYSSTGSLKKPG